LQKIIIIYLQASLNESLTKPLVLEGIVESQNNENMPLASPSEDCVQSIASDISTSAVIDSGSGT